MPTVDERARAMLKSHQDAYINAGVPDGMDVVFENPALAAITTAISQFDEARAVALEEAARVVEDAPTYKGGLCLITTPQLVEAIRALGNLTATSEGEG